MRVYNILEPGSHTKPGDEFWLLNNWRRVANYYGAHVIVEDHDIVRRPVDISEEKVKRQAGALREKERCIDGYKARIKELENQLYQCGRRLDVVQAEVEQYRGRVDYYLGRLADRKETILRLREENDKLKRDLTALELIKATDAFFGNGGLTGKSEVERLKEEHAIKLREAHGHWAKLKLESDDRKANHDRMVTELADMQKRYHAIRNKYLNLQYLLKKSIGL